MGDRILFITTKNLDYIRNIQEIKLAREWDQQTRVIGSSNPSYFMRLLQVWGQLLLFNPKTVDVVWIGFAPQLVLPFLGKFKGKKIVIDFFISLYDTLCYDRKIVRADTLVGRLLFRLDQSTLRRADLVICDTDAHKKYFLEEFGVTDKEYRTLYLEADTKVFYPREVKRPAALKGKYIVLYFGSILPLQGVEVILEAIEQIREKEGLHFFIIGPLRKKLSGWAPMGDNITYIDWLSEEELAKYIAMADLCLAGHFHGDIQKAARTVPGKAYIYQAMNKPMILGDNQANREVFKEGKEVKFVPMGNHSALAESILAMAEQNN